MFAPEPENARNPDVTTVTPFAGWLTWRLRALGSNPLIRSSDRLETFTMLAVLLVSLFAIPVAVHAGQLGYDSGVAAAHEQAQTRHSVDALVVQGNGVPMEFDTPAYVTAQWQEGTRTRSEQVVSPATIKAGDHMTIWLDGHGRVTAAPLTVEDAKITAVAAAAIIWIAVVAAAALTAWLIRLGLNRSRDRAWERELLLLAHNDDGWANRHI